jgi:hypothetical protein
VRGEHRGSGRGDAQPDAACLAASDAADCGLGGGNLVEDDFRAGEQFGAGAGDGNPAGGAGEERCAEFALEAADQFAERRRGDVQPLGGPPEVQFGGYGHERFELTQLHMLTVPRPLAADRMRCAWPQDCSAWPKSAFASCLFFGCGHGVMLTASVAGTPAAAGPRGGTR